MLERFTHAARAVVVRAQEESAALGHDHVGSEHLLLALATAGGDTVAGVLGSLGAGADALRAAVERRDPDGLDADALASIGIDLDEVRRSVEESFGPGALGGRRAGEGGGRARHRPFTPHAKRVLERSVREAVALRDRGLAPEHLLLGVAGERDGGAAAALRACGTAPDALRAATLRALREAA
jgi:ATP-dependent Clp protease ATP-binding subunit ClpA